MSGSTGLKWKPDWAAARAAHMEWWRHKGLLVNVSAPRNIPWENVREPEKTEDMEVLWGDAGRWIQSSLYGMSRTFYGGGAFPNMNTNIGGPGSLGLFLGATGHGEPTTMWYEPCINDPPEDHPPLFLDTAGKPWNLHMRLLREAVALSRGRYVVGFPDLVENMDTLAQLRDPQTLLVDLIDRPSWVRDRICEINSAFFQAYDHMYEVLKDPWGGSCFSAFSLWGEGKVAKVQCDFSCMISEEMFREFVVPSLTEQCDWLDYSLYHLDGTQAMQHLPALYEIESLDAIEWTPQAGIEGGGSPRWYGLYRDIKKAGKSVQAIGVKPHELEPLLDAVGPEGMYVWMWAKDEEEARNLLDKVGWKN